jgi:arylformamidase
MPAPSTVFDITPPITPAINTWPGDTPYSRSIMLDTAHGDVVTLSSITTTGHLGAHADGPNHYGDSRTNHGVGEWPLIHFLGPCHVIDVRAARATRVRANDLAPARAAAIKHLPRL